MNKSWSIGEYWKGKTLPQEVKAKISASLKNKPPWNVGIKHTMETRRKMSLAKKGHITWNKGKHITEEHRSHISKSLTGRLAWNRGKARTPEEKLAISRAQKLRWQRFKEQRSQASENENKPRGQGLHLASIAGIPLLTIGMSLAATGGVCLEKTRAVYVDVDTVACTIADFRMVDPHNLNSLVTVSGLNNTGTQQQMSPAADILDASKGVLDIANALVPQTKPFESVEYLA